MGADMGDGRPTRFNVVLDEEHAAKLHLMAERAYLQPGALARSLLSGAIDAADPDPQIMTDVLNSIPGFWEGVAAAEAELEAGLGIPLDQFAATFAKRE